MHVATRAAVAAILMMLPMGACDVFGEPEPLNQQLRLAHEYPMEVAAKLPVSRRTVGEATCDPGDQAACSYNGVCSDDGLSCDCIGEFWRGATCTIPANQCPGYGLQADGSFATDVCGGHGDCIAPLTCSCDQGFTGEACERSHQIANPRTPESAPVLAAVAPPPRPPAPRIEVSPITRHDFVYSDYGDGITSQPSGCCVDCACAGVHVPDGALIHELACAGHGSDVSLDLIGGDTLAVLELGESRLTDIDWAVVYTPDTLLQLTLHEPGGVAADTFLGCTLTYEQQPVR